LNLQATSADPYDACPYCLTDLTQCEELVSIPAESPKTVVESPEVTAEAEVPIEETADIPQQSSNCDFHMGYLSERASKDQIPDNCMTCKDIVECMLKKMRQ